MSGSFKVTFTDDRGDADPARSFEMSKTRLEAHFPKEIELLQKSPCSAVSIANHDGNGGRDY